MTPKEYTEFVVGLASEASTKDIESVYATAALGLAGESGEFADLVKKILFQGKESTAETQHKMLSELSDILWYITFAASKILDFSLQDIIDFNVAKLTKRYPTGKFQKKDFLNKEMNEK